MVFSRNIYLPLGQLDNKLYLNCSRVAGIYDGVRLPMQIDFLLVLQLN